MLWGTGASVPGRLRTRALDPGCVDRSVAPLYLLARDFKQLNSLGLRYFTCKVGLATVCLTASLSSIHGTIIFRGGQMDPSWFNVSITRSRNSDFQRMTPEVSLLISLLSTSPRSE